MHQLSSYEILEKLNETATAEIFRGREKNADQTVIVKFLKTDQISEANIARFRQEWEIIQTIKSSGIVQAYAITTIENRIVLILEDFKGVPLTNKIEVIQSDLELFFTLAIEMAHTLGEIHQGGIIHKDINPSNFSISFDPLTVKIADFGISNILGKGHVDTFAIPEGSLNYISPEQTGRMNRLVDYRSDYYSLGITFYEMLTGAVPFNFPDPMELIHSHIARIPVAPADAEKRIPDAVSEIVMKLIAKTCEERYQSAYSIVKDLKNCRDQLINTGTIEPFKIAQNDVPHVYIPPQIIVGRDNEIAGLKKCYDNVCSGKCEIVLVAGESGIGKSTLIHELYKPIIESRGYFISGKYNQYRKNVPYSAFIQAFREFVSQILAESPEVQNDWKKKFLQAVGKNGRVLIENLPEIEQIIGKQPELTEIEPEQEQYRFKYVFKNVFNILSSRKTPLTIFLDDLQWVDLPSLDFIEMIGKDTDNESLLLICAYRDNEVDQGHPFSMLMDKFAAYDCPVERITLPPLKVSDVNRLIVSAFYCDERKSLPLAQIVYSKTNGNPFFVNQYLLDLFKKRYFTFNLESGWEWNIADIANLQITDNVVKLMSLKLNELTPETVRILKLCSCIGNQFDLVTLSLITRKSIGETLKHVQEAVNNGLIIFNNEKYRFVHDKIYEAAYLLSSDAQKKEMHLLIARTVLNNTHEEILQKRLHYIVDQYNKGADLITDNGELNLLVRMNLEAGKKAKKSIAYKSAAGYFETGLVHLKSLNPDPWHDHYDLSIELYPEAAQTMMFLFEYEKMDEYVNCVLENATGVFDKISIYETLILRSFTENDSAKALKIGLAASRQIGMKFPEKFLKAHIALNLIYTMIRLTGTSPEDFVNLPEADDPLTKVQMRLLSAYASAAYTSNTDYIPLFSLKCLMVIKRIGNNPSSPASLATYGTLLCLLGKYEKATAYCQAALKIIDKFKYYEQNAKIYLIMAALVMHWRENLRDLEALLMKGYNYGLEYGDHIFAAHCLTVSAIHNFHAAYHLDAYESLLKKYSAILKDKRQIPAFCSVNIHLKLCMNLKSNSEAFDLLKSGFSDEETATLVSAEMENNKTNRYYSYFLESILSYLAGNYKRADIYIKKSKKEAEGALGLYAHAILVFYRSLIDLALYPESGLWRKIFLRLRLWLNSLKMKRQACVAPMNHLNKYYIIKAGIAQIRQQRDRAADYFYKAIEASAANGFIHEEGMAHELATNFYQHIGHKKTAAYHFNKAKTVFAKWGANAKLKQLEKKYPEYSIRKEDLKDTIAQRAVADPKKMSDIQSLDLLSIMKSSQAFSSIFELDLLLKKVLAISMENAGAQKGALILEKDGEYFIEAEGTIDGSFSSLNSIPLGGGTQVCKAIVNFVLHRKKSIVLPDATNRGDYVSDNYILKNKPKSVLAVPVIYQKKFSGVLYLENNLATDAFSPERVKLLQLLTTQAAISIKIARQSNELSLANKAKTGFLKTMAHELRTPLHGIEGELQLLKDIVARHAVHGSIDHIDNISSSSKRLMAAINRVLDFTDLENDTFSLNLSVFNIAKRIAVITDVIKEDLKTKNIDFKVNIDTAIPELIEGDEKRIHEIILGLLENSIKFTATGSIFLGVSFRDDSQLDIIVKDTGKGIPKDKLKHIFNAFEQAKSRQTFTKPYEGLGLGLSIIAKIVQIMGGKISMTSREGQGSTFNVIIPAGKIGLQATSTPDLSKLHALIVEDNNVNTKILTSYLSKLKIQSETARDGKIGLEKYATGQFNIIFMDVQMPVMNGIEATIAIRKSEADQIEPVKIIGVTANATKQECIDAGMDAFIQKPVSFDAVYETLIGVTRSGGEKTLNSEWSESY